MMLKVGKLQKAVKRAALRAGTTVTLHWIKWPDGRPDADPVTGSTPSTDDTEPVDKSRAIKALVHFIQPSQSGLRMNLEIEVGDVILDGLPKLYQITDAGGTDYEVGDVVAENQLKGTACDSGEPAQGDEVQLSSLERLRFEIAGKFYGQKKISEKLTQGWDAIVADQKLSSSILLTIIT